MTARKKILKVFIIVILLVFLLSTGLISVMYLGGNKNASQETGDADTGALIETGPVEAVIETGANTSKMTKEESSKNIQELLSGVNTSDVAK